MISLPPMLFPVPRTNLLPNNLDTQRRHCVPRGGVIMIIPGTKVKFLALGCQKSRSKYKMEKMRKNSKSVEPSSPIILSFLPRPSRCPPPHTPSKMRSKLPDWSEGSCEKQRGYVSREQLIRGIDRRTDQSQN